MSPLVTAPPRRGRFHELTVTAVERLTPEAVAVTFAVGDVMAQFAFEPGQYVTLRAQIEGQEVRRSYSICSSRADVAARRELRVAVARVPGGVMSNWLNDHVAVGDRLAVMAPLGRFTCPTRPDQARHHVAIAGGSGITPVYSLLKTALEEEPASRATLIFGNRCPASIMFRADLQVLREAYPDRFELITVLEEGAQEELLSGVLDPPHLAAILQARVPVADVHEWYLCGPYPMLIGARQLLTDWGVDQAHVHDEVFFDGVSGGDS